MAPRRSGGYNQGQLNFDHLWAEPENARDEQVARLAMSHWQKTDPDRYRQIPDPEAFFQELGERAEIEIGQLQDAIAGPDRPGESYLEKVGRLNMARLSAEEQILAETVLIPGPRAQEDEEEQETSRRTSRRPGTSR